MESVTKGKLWVVRKLRLPSLQSQSVWMSPCWRSVSPLLDINSQYSECRRSSDIFTKIRRMHTGQDNRSLGKKWIIREHIDEFSGARSSWIHISLICEMVWRKTTPGKVQPLNNSYVILTSQRVQRGQVQLNSYITGRSLICEMG